MNEVNVSILIPARHSGHCIARTVTELTHFFSAFSNFSYEILLIPNGSLDPVDRTLEICRELEIGVSSVRVVDQPLSGKGRALRTGFAASRGRYVFMVDSDLPYGLDFLRRALAEMDQGADFVTANRRLPESSFTCPVPLLPLVYKRHRLGLAFNRLVRILFSVKSLDTQAGMKGMKREFAAVAFRRSVCPGFLADVEYFLVAKELDALHRELPVSFLLFSEKSTVRLFREFFATLMWLPCFAWRRARGRYARVEPYRRSRFSRLLSFFAYSRLPFAERLRRSWSVTRLEPVSVAVASGGGVGVVEPEKPEQVLRLALECPDRQVIVHLKSQSRAEEFRRLAHGIETIQITQTNTKSLLPSPLAPEGWSAVWCLSGVETFAVDPDVLKDGGLWIEPDTDSAEGVSQWPGEVWKELGQAWLRKHGPARPGRLGAVTADDWGISPGVNRGILDLARRGVVRRVSMMATAPYVQEGLSELLVIPELDFGMHWDLTSQWTLWGSPKALLKGLLNPGAHLETVRNVRKSFQTQWGKLESLRVRLSYVDGHHHSHLLPGVRAVLAEEVEARGIRRVRVPYDRRLWRTAKWPLNVLSLLARRFFRRRGLISVECRYPVGSDWGSFPSLCRALAGSEFREVIVHPAADDDLAATGCVDPYTAGRVREYRMLSLLASAPA